MLTPTCHASRWFRTFPVISGWVLAQAAAWALAVKKLMARQLDDIEGIEGRSWSH